MPRPNDGRVSITTRKQRAEIRKLEADADKAEADARKAAGDAAQAELTRLTPDLSKLVVPELASHEGQASAGSRVTFGALEEAADKVAKAVQGHKPTRVLVTNDVDLVSGDATYQTVSTTMATLIDAAKSLLRKPDPAKRALIGLGLVEIASIAASVVPQAISLLLPKRSLAVSAITVDDLAASAEVLGALLTLKIGAVHDDFQMVGSGEVYSTFQTLQGLRRDLAKEKLLLPVASADVPLDEETKRKVAAIDSLVAAIDTFASAATSAGASAGRPALATAAIYGLLRTGEKRISHVLLVKSQSGSMSEHREDRPLIMADTFTTIADVHLTFMVLDTKTGELVDAGTSTATAVASGKIGEVPTVNAVPTVIDTVGKARELGARPYVP